MAETKKETQNWFPWLVAIALALLIMSLLTEPTFEHSAISIRVLFSSLTKELGVAVLIGWVISIGIEREARRKDAKDAESRRQSIAENVVAGVFSVQYPASYVKTVVEVTLRPTVIRETYRTNYVIRYLSDSEQLELGVSGARFVVFCATRSFRLRNVSAIPFPVRSTIPVRRAIKLRNFAKLTGAVLGGVPVDPVDIESALEADDVTPEHKNYKFVRKIDPGDCLDVAFESRMIKELSDNEPWSTIYPTTQGVDFMIQVIPGMHFGLNALTASKLRKELVSEDRGTGTWKIDGDILPNDSVIFWWRTPEDDGETAVAQPLDSLDVKCPDIAHSLTLTQPKGDE